MDNIYKKELEKEITKLDTNKYIVTELNTNKYKLSELNIIDKLKNKYCNICNKNGWNTQLFYYNSIEELYCNNCIEIIHNKYSTYLCDYDHIKPLYFS